MLPVTLNLAEGVLTGSRRALSKAITLVESKRLDHRAQGELLVDFVMHRRQQALEKTIGSSISRRIQQSLRIGVAGPPGAGKSTFIEALGEHITKRGLKLAVIPYDPSSTRTGGSILGDKTRMLELSRNPNAFIRPCPTRGMLGGVAEATHETVLLCQAAGYDIVIIESVGLGQSELDIDDAADMLLLLTSPAAGDGLQGVKKGIMEVADILVVNKADGELLPAARRAAAQLKSSLKFQRQKHPNWQPAVLLASAMEQTGIEEVWGTAQQFREAMLESTDDAYEERLRAQATRALWRNFAVQMENVARQDKSIAEMATPLEMEIASGFKAPRAAARHLIEKLLL